MYRNYCCNVYTAVQHSYQKWVYPHTRDPKMFCNYRCNVCTAEKPNKQKCVYLHTQLFSWNPTFRRSSSGCEKMQGWLVKQKAVEGCCLQPGASIKQTVLQVSPASACLCVSDTSMLILKSKRVPVRRIHVDIDINLKAGHAPN